MPADVVVGQIDFNLRTNGTSAISMDEPVSLAVAGGKMFVADKSNNRLLIWNNIPTTNGKDADIVLGQPDFISNAIGRSATSFALPSSVWSDGNRLVVCDSGNNRVLIWNSIPTSNLTPPDIVVGQSDFISAAGGTSAAKMIFPSSVFSNGVQLYIADTGNNRVLIYNNFPTKNLESADIVLGQSNFANSSPNDDDQDNMQDFTPSARTLSCPTSVFSNAGQLFVTDNCNHRILIFNKIL